VQAIVAAVRIPGPRSIIACALAAIGVAAPSASAATTTRFERIAGYNSRRS
jgi:hypothetical protein